MVHAPERSLSERICVIAERAQDRLLECGLSPVPPMRVDVVDRIDTPHGRCLAATDCIAGTIAVTHPDSLTPHAERAVYGGQIAPLAVFDSLIVHELVHAALHETLGGREVGVAAHEYLAYALQIEALSPEDREVFLAHQDTAAPTSLEELNSIILMFAPGVFAAKSWLHFSQADHGCGFVELLIDGTVELGSPGI